MVLQKLQKWNRNQKPWKTTSFVSSLVIIVDFLCILFWLRLSMKSWIIVHFLYSYSTGVVSWLLACIKCKWFEFDHRSDKILKKILIFIWHLKAINFIINYIFFFLSIFEKNIFHLNIYTLEGYKKNIYNEKGISW